MEEALEIRGMAQVKSSKGCKNSHEEAELHECMNEIWLAALTKLTNNGKV